ncbi:MAG: 2-oxoacid:acceptor oxidoreductase family protein [Terriglobia bacterium]
MPTHEIRIAGFGGQGVILAGMVIGKAATLFDNKFVTLTQSFGPEARGSACSVQLIVSPEPILYPYITKPDILVVMSQEACTRFCSQIQPGGVMLYEQDLITPGKKCAPDVRRSGIPATRLAEELGRKLVLNMVMVGFVTAMTSITTADAVRKAIASSVPKGTEQLNLAAFEKGYEYGRTQLASSASAA